MSVPYLIFLHTFLPRVRVKGSAYTLYVKLKNNIAVGPRFCEVQFI